MGRIVEQTEVKRRGREHITQSPAEYYQRVYLDLVSPSRLAIRYAYDFAGPDRLVFGSDHPWVRVDTMLDLLTQLDVPPPDQAKIMGLNAARLFRI
jgi:predicted TIM-barrel fold metal-dependent hydrolase